MRSIKRFATVAFVALAASMLAIGAQATTVYDTSLANPPGVFFGSGNANSNFTVDNEGNIQLGLSAITRYIGPIDPGAGSNVYTTTTGDTSVSGKTGSVWGFDFSINTQNGGGTATLSSYTYLLSMTDVAQGTTGGFNPLLIPDNSYFGSPAATAAQNSETPSFTGIALGFNDPAFTDAINDTFIFNLEALSDGRVVADDQIVVVQGTGATVPEPGTIFMLVVGLVAVCFFGRKHLGSRRDDGSNFSSAAAS